MKKSLWNSIVLCLVIAGTQLLAAENPFVGTWKLNPAKSKFTGGTITFEQTPSGEWKTTAMGMSYTFRMDGKEYQGPFDRKVSWKQANDRSWQSTITAAGKTLVNERYELSPDNKTLTVTAEGTTPSGEKFKEVSSHGRESGSSGLAGKWRSNKVQISSPMAMEIKAHGANGISMSIPQYKASVDLALDGTEAKPVGPTIPPGITFSAKKVDEHSFDFVEKHNGKPIATMKMKVSADGKTLTENGKPAGVDEPYTAVYDREK